MRRGEVWWVDLEPTRGSEIRKRRPAAIVSVDALDEVRRRVVVPPSSAPVPRPSLVVPVPSLGPGSVAICDQVRAVDKRRLGRREGALAAADLRAVEAELRVVLGLLTVARGGPRGRGSPRASKDGTW